jgi:menaquinone-dependent protoporphyrinogen oxidase
MGKWTKASIKFLNKNKDSLAKRKIALFVTCEAANDEKNSCRRSDKIFRQCCNK